jgi:hypothetical protein
MEPTETRTRDLPPVDGDDADATGAVRGGAGVSEEGAQRIVVAPLLSAARHVSRAARRAPLPALLASASSPSTGGLLGRQVPCARLRGLHHDEPKIMGGFGGESR